jgi:serine/threonine protein kinase/WD40 repeat protein
VSADRTEAFPPPDPSGAPAPQGAPASPLQPTEAATLPASASSPRPSGEFVLSSGSNDQPLGGWPTVQGYEILAEIGRGGMGVVYKARQAGLKRLVALKMILSGGHASAAELTRFCSEAEAIARLQHPNIVHIHEVGESEGRPYFSLEFVDGGSLADRLDGTPWPPPQAARLIETLAQAMQAAHEQNIIHRDLKPANILLQKKSEGKKHKPDEKTDRSKVSDSSLLTLDFSPKITDFGLAKQMDSEHGQTRSGAIMGTPSYMAPEQAGGKGKEVGPATDVYALGAVLYELLTGRPPFKAATPLDTVLQVVGEDPVPPRRLQPKLPRDLDTICLKCLEKNPAKRYPSAAELADDLERWRQLQPIRARRISRVGRGVRWCRRNPVLASVTALATAVILTLSVVFYVSLLWENDRTKAALRQTKIEEDQSQDILARSKLEQARAVRLSNQPGRRWQALELLAEAEKLRDRKRLVNLPPEALDQALPTEAELRREAAAALLLEDARIVRKVSLAAMPLYRTEIGADGRHALAWWARPHERPVKIGIRLFDLRDGKILGQTRLPLEAHKTLAISPDEKLLAFLTPDGLALQLREFPVEPPRDSIFSRPNEPDGLPPLAGIIHNGLFFSPDGRYIVNVRSVESQADLYLWDLQDHAASRHLARVEAGVAEVSFRADSRMLAYRSGEKKIALVDLTTGGKTTEIDLPLTIAGANPPQSGRPTTLLWSPTESLLAVVATGSTGKGTILLWDADAGNERSRWEGDFDPDSILLAFSPDGKRLACGGANGTIRCYHIGDRREILRLEGAHHDGVNCLRWENSGTLLSAGMFNSFRAWEFSDASLRSSVPVVEEHVGQILYSPNGRWLAYRVGGKQPRVVVIENPSGAVRHAFDLPASDGFGRILFRPDSGQLAWVTSTGDALAWDLADGRERTRRKGDASADDPWFDPAFTADGRLVTAAARKGRVVFRDLLTGEEIAMRPEISVNELTESGVRGLLVSSNHRRLLGLPGERDLLRVAIPVWDIATGEREGQLEPLEDEVSGIIYAGQSSDGRRLLKICIPASFDASVGSSEPVLSLWNLDTRRLLWRAQRNVLPSVWAFSADGALLAIGYQNGFVELWDVEKGEELFRWQPRGPREVRHITFSPDNADIATSDAAAPVQLLHLAELRRQLAAMGLDW